MPIISKKSSSFSAKRILHFPIRLSAPLRHKFDCMQHFVRSISGLIFIDCKVLPNLRRVMQSYPKFSLRWPCGVSRASSQLTFVVLLGMWNCPVEARWDNLGLSSDGDQLQVLRDPQTGTRQPNGLLVRSATMRLLLKPHTLQDPRNGQWVADIVSEWVFKCPAELGAIKLSRIHYEDGSSKKSDANSGYRAISRNDLVFTQMRELCGVGNDQ
jgi:hypothetical protein